MQRLKEAKQRFGVLSSTIVQPLTNSPAVDIANCILTWVLLSILFLSKSMLLGYICSSLNDFWFRLLIHILGSQSSHLWMLFRICRKQVLVVFHGVSGASLNRPLIAIPSSPARPHPIKMAADGGRIDFVFCSSLPQTLIRYGILIAVSSLFPII